MDKIDTLNKKLTPINKVQTNNNLLNTEKNIYNIRQNTEPDELDQYFYYIYNKLRNYNKFTTSKNQEFE